jgi:hypothetical protein
MLSFRDAPLGAGPESILTIVVMDSQMRNCASWLALCAPRNDEAYRDTCAATASHFPFCLAQQSV